MQGLRSATVRYIRLRRNAGVGRPEPGPGARAGQYIVLMDADGGTTPRRSASPPPAPGGRALDLVTGPGRSRNGRFVKRTTSKLYNGVTSKVTGVPGKDFNSGLKAMTASADTLEMYGELHRYIPVLAVWNGFRTGSSTSSTTNVAGTSKFGHRFWRDFLDLVSVKFLTTSRRGRSACSWIGS